MSKKNKNFSFGRDPEEETKDVKKSLEECANVQEYLAQFEDVGAGEENQLPPAEEDFEYGYPVLAETVSAPHPTNPVVESAKKAVRSYLKNVGETKETHPAPKTPPEPIRTKAEAPAPQKEEVKQDEGLQRRHRSSIYLKKMYDHECIAVQDRLGDIMLFPIQPVITAKIIPGKEDAFIHSVATVIALCATPSAIFTKDEFADYVDAANIQAINLKSTFIGTTEEFLYAFRIWSYLETELMDVKKQMDETYGEHIFASSIMLLISGIYARSPLSLPKYRLLVSTTIYDTPWEETARENFIKFLINEYERGHADAPLNAYDLEDYILYDLFEEVSTFLEVTEEEEDLEDGEDAAIEAMMSQAFEEMNEYENKEVIIDDGNGGTGEVAENEQQPVQKVGNQRPGRERVNSVSGQGFGEMVQNVYAAATTVQQSVSISQQSGTGSGGNGHWPTLEEVEKAAAEKVKAQEEAQARQVHDCAGAGGGENPKTQAQKEEEKEEDDPPLVIPVNRGGKG